jgi:hypothetical protein
MLFGLQEVAFACLKLEFLLPQSPAEPFRLAQTRLPHLACCLPHSLLLAGFYAQIEKNCFYGAVHSAPTLTQSLVSGQQTSFVAQLASVQNLPGAVGVRQCWKRERQKDQLGVRGAEWRQLALLRTLASGQQYSVVLQTGGATHGLPGMTQI